MYVGKPPFLFAGPASPRDAAVRRSYLRIRSGLSDLGDDFRRTYERSTDPPPAANIVDDQTE